MTQLLLKTPRSSNLVVSHTSWRTAAMEKEIPIMRRMRRMNQKQVTGSNAAWAVRWTPTHGSHTTPPSSTGQPWSSAPEGRRDTGSTHSAWRCLRPCCSGSLRVAKSTSVRTMEACPTRRWPHLDKLRLWSVSPWKLRKGKLLWQSRCRLPKKAFSEGYLTEHIYVLVDGWKGVLFLKNG